jgi:hypothetical protein
MMGAGDTGREKCIGSMAIPPRMSPMLALMELRTAKPGLQVCGGPEEYAIKQLAQDTADQWLPN